MSEVHKFEATTTAHSRVPVCALASETLLQLFASFSSDKGRGPSCDTREILRQVKAQLQ